MINEQKEIWISTGNKSNYRIAIIAVSNCGRIMRKNGKIEIASFEQVVSVGEKRSRMYLYRFLANNFIVKTEEDILKQRNVIDHITHTPDSMYVNDVRNLRWCTNRENCNFPEAKAAKSAAQLGNTNSKGYKHSEEAKAKISAAKKGNTYAKGKKHSDDTKAKMSAAQIGNTKSKGLHWYTNGVVNKFTKECPLGFTSGKLQKKKSSIK